MAKNLVASGALTLSPRPVILSSAAAAAVPPRCHPRAAPSSYSQKPTPKHADTTSQRKGCQSPGYCHRNVDEWKRTLIPGAVHTCAFHSNENVFKSCCHLGYSSLGEVPRSTHTTR